MAELLHPWWENFGRPLAEDERPSSSYGATLLHLIETGRCPGVECIAAKVAETGLFAIGITIEVERPQDLVHPIRGVEPIAIVFGADDHQPAVLALRSDFPETMHQNYTPTGAPRCLCVDDRPWNEIRLSFTPQDLLRRVQLWLSKAARGELHDPAQPVEPLFFRNTMALVLPRAAFAPGDDSEIIGYRRPDNENDRLILARMRTANDSRAEAPGNFMVIAIRGTEQPMGPLRQAAQSLQELALALGTVGIDLIGILAARIRTWAGLQDDDLHRMSARFVIAVSFPIRTGNGVVDDLRAFITHDTIGDIGRALGIVSENESDVGSKKAFMPIIGGQPTLPAAPLPVDPADVHLHFDRQLALEISAQTEADRRKILLVGAGSEGSQVAMNLVREGRFHWTIIDSDILYPHNLARHALGAFEVGAPKAAGLARTLAPLLREPVTALRVDFLAPTPDRAEALEGHLSEAEIILDTSASVAVARYLAGRGDLRGRRVCAFFNPAGTAVVVLTEDSARTVSLFDLEAQYHRVLQMTPHLADHLSTESGGVRYSGSCRSVTNRISASKASLLSAIASRGIIDAISSDTSSVAIWTVSERSEVRRDASAGLNVIAENAGAWTIKYSADVGEELKALRNRHLPRETGGVLLGLIDTQRRTVHIVCALPEPADSEGTVAGFQRGVEGLAEAIDAVAKRSLYQLRYIGEWHSHPRGASTRPSVTDMRQVAWLSSELADEGLPAIMLIVGDHGTPTVVLGGTADIALPASPGDGA